MLTLKIFTYPIDEVILEHTLDKLVEDVWSYQFINIRAREIFSEGLKG